MNKKRCLVDLQRLRKSPAHSFHRDFSHIAKTMTKHVQAVVHAVEDTTYKDYSEFLPKKTIT